MTDSTEAVGDAGPDGESAGTGRYLYCVAALIDAPEVADGTGLSTDGVDGERPYLVLDDGVGAVVHRRNDPYDSNDGATVKRWLLEHQGVVDAVHDRFGTPLPVRFDTIVEGDDESVAAWLERTGPTLRSALDDLAGHSEYRIELRCDADPFGASAVDADARLDELRDDATEAGSGTAFLREKQARQRERSLVATEWRETAAAVRETLASHATEVESVDRTVSSLVETDRADDADFETTFAALADDAAATAIGERLDEVAATPGVEVRYTGPWPPYTFAPTLETDQ
ncbi:gas vesicle protein GvpL [Haloarcula salina]|uniref:GvpL/GvpF family gas vesicle protein n=1 Tax=Haloarcula salina TaxID=1429914 RepID=A0AA41G1V4_9EURY|nr:GvpL/GvpF family gas vesicle protein [Haloarcula salina]MBV0901936.1 GvpL/GvpF family gas vesicle protein [Haloarcula salina]